jgi:GrpB-like predicted nucleotidyltransferase (UPF0157 family)
MPSKVEIVPYDAAWPGLFRQLATSLRSALGDRARRIDHIGSTAVPHLDAKPIIDVQISVADLEPVDDYRYALTDLGFVFRADNPDRTKRYFRESPGQRRTHIHVRRYGSLSEQLALVFRDYLRAHPTDARRYAEHKRELAARFVEDRAGYTDAKDPYVWEIMRVATRWSQESNWQPGPSDA